MGYLLSLLFAAAAFVKSGLAINSFAAFVMGICRKLWRLLTGQNRRMKVVISVEQPRTLHVAYSGEEELTSAGWMEVWRGVDENNEAVEVLIYQRRGLKATIDGDSGEPQPPRK